MPEQPKTEWLTKAFLFGMSLAIGGCANLISRKPVSSPLITRNPFPLISADRPLFPTWVFKTPAADTHVYAVGEAFGAIDKEEALAKSWASALVRMGMAEFPELSQVASSHVESLNGGSSASRGLVLHLERVNWAGLSEVKEKGSPLVYWDETEGAYRAFRLLKWDRAHIEAARALFKKNQPSAIPLPPEMMVREEQSIFEAVTEIQRINFKNSYKQKLYRKVFGELRCGVTIADLIKVLGAPDRFNPYNRIVMDKEYYWGDYRVEREGADPRITAIITQGNGRENRKTCR